MEVTFIKEVKVKYDFDPIQIANLAIDEYKKEFPEYNRFNEVPEYDKVVEFIDEHIFDYLEKLGLTEEDKEVIWDGASDPLFDLNVQIVRCFQQNFK